MLGLSVSGNGFMLPIDGVPTALKLAVLGGHPDLPVAYGRFHGLLDVGGFPESWRRGAMEFYRNAGLPEIARPPYPGSAADLIVELIRDSERKVTILGLGPNTNVALAFAQEPAILANVEQVVLSAGAFDVAGNVVKDGLPETFLENRASYRALVAKAAAKSVAEYNVFLDAPATCTDLRASSVQVVVDNSEELGRTVAGRFGKSAYVCYKIDPERFYRSFLDTVSEYPN